MKKILLALVLLASLAFAGVLWMLSGTYKGFTTPSVLVTIPRGASSARIAELLTEKGVVASPLHFRLARLLDPKARLQAGEYRFAEAAAVRDVYARLVRGDIFRIAVTFPEGSSRFDMARILAGEGFGTEAEFLGASASPELIRDLAPNAPSLEGYLFPATYLFARGTSADQICREMTRRFRQAWKAAGGDTASVHRVTTMASLIEKETGVPAERPVVSSVYWNRLHQKMKLEADPTVSYAALLDHRWRGKIYRSDLNNPHPYNTYQHTGLPPGPIASPGQKSLEAALKPDSTDYIFFVARADGSGGHNFSKDLRAHQKAVASYRTAVKKSADE